MLFTPGISLKWMSISACVGLVAGMSAVVHADIIEDELRARASLQLAQPAGDSLGAELTYIAENRDAVIDSILASWGMSIENQNGSITQLETALSMANTEELLAASNAGSLSEVQNALSGGSANIGLTITANGEVALPLTLGSTSTDLVYSPVPPCRIVDTRLTPAGTITAGTSREFWVYGPPDDIELQGGDPAGCFAPRGEPLAVHINVTRVPTSGNGNLEVYPADVTATGTSWVNSKIGVNTANAGTVQTYSAFGPKEIEVQANFGDSQVVIDVLGYYYAVDKNDFVVKTAGSFTAAATGLVAGAGCTNYSGGSVTIVAPGPGTIVVEANVQLNLASHTAGTSDTMTVYIGTNSTDCSVFAENGYLAGVWTISDGHPTRTGSTADIKSLYVPRTFTVASGGTYTYYVNGVRDSGAGGGGFVAGAMKATFYPDP